MTVKEISESQLGLDSNHILVSQIVDFCCGSNDFSCLLKKKLDETGKSCSYKNYDIVQAKVNSIILICNMYFVLQGENILAKCTLILKMVLWSF